MDSTTPPTSCTAVMSKSTPITVLTGFLGAGKTSMILSILQQLPPDYKVVVLKNEFGDVEVDSLLTSQPSIAGVSEILNGCVCCVLVGQMKTALLEIKENFNPDRIIVESSGSAFPATLAWQVRELERETNGAMSLDAVLTVIDCLNFVGYEDTSPTAKLQAQYTDLLILNKHDLATDRQLDTVLDHLYTLNDETPMLRHSPSAPLSPSVLFGLDSQLFSRREEEEEKFKALGWEGNGHAGEVESVGVYRGGEGENGGVEGHDGHVHGEGCGHESHLPAKEGEGEEKQEMPSWEEILAFLSTLPSTVYRVKGLLNLTPPPPSALSSASASGSTPFSAQPLPPLTTPLPTDPTTLSFASSPARSSSTPPQSTSPPLSAPASAAAAAATAEDPDAHLPPSAKRLYILNWAFGRYTLTRMPPSAVKEEERKKYEGVEVRVTLMGERGEVKKWGRRMGETVGGVAR